MDLFGVSVILCKPLQYFQLFFLSVLHCLFCAEYYQKPVYAFASGQVFGKCFENPETFVEITQKLEVSNRTIRRSQVVLHFLL
jgi:hypothetical protein